MNIRESGLGPGQSLHTTLLDAGLAKILVQHKALVTSSSEAGSGTCRSMAKGNNSTKSTQPETREDVFGSLAQVCLTIGEPQTVGFSLVPWCKTTRKRYPGTLKHGHARSTNFQQALDSGIVPGRIHACR